MRRWVKTATLASPLLRQGATPSPAFRWPPEPPSHRGPSRHIARASRNRFPSAGRHSRRLSRTASGTPPQLTASIGRVPGAPSLPLLRTQAPLRQLGTRALSLGSVAYG